MTTRIIIAIIIAHILTAAYGLLFLLPDGYALQKANYFLNQSVMPGGMERAWYYKFMSEYLLHCVTYICFAAVAWKYNRKLFLVIGVFNIYHLLDFIMFLVDFNQSWWLYIVLGWMVLIGCIMACWPVKETGRVVRL